MGPSPSRSYHEKGHERGEQKWMTSWTGAQRARWKTPQAQKTKLMNEMIPPWCRHPRAATNPLEARTGDYIVNSIRFLRPVIYWTKTRLLLPDNLGQMLYSRLFWPDDFQNSLFSPTLAIQFRPKFSNSARLFSPRE